MTDELKTDGQTVETDKTGTNTETKTDTTNTQSASDNEENKYRRLFEKSQKRLEELEAKEQERERAKLDEVERLRLEKEDAIKEAAALKAQVLKAELCDKAEVPFKYRKYITGADAEAINASIEQAKADFAWHEQQTKSTTDANQTQQQTTGTGQNPPLTTGGGAGKSDDLDTQIEAALKRGDVGAAVALKRQKFGL